MALSCFDTSIMKAVQVTHHQGGIRYGLSRDRCAMLMYVTYVISLDIKSASIWNFFDL